MYAIRKSDLKEFTPNSQSVCRILDGSTNPFLRDPRAIELFLRKVEPKYNAALNALRQGEIDRNSIYAIAGFVAYVIVCSATGMRLLSGPLKTAAETLVVRSAEQGLLPEPPDIFREKSVAEMIRDGDIVIEVDPKYPQELAINSILRNVAAFGNFESDILINQIPENPFLTSDFPIVVEPTGDWRVQNRIVPLSPDLAIRIRPQLGHDRRLLDFSFSKFSCRRRKVSKRDVAEINRGVVQCAEDMVFSSGHYPWIRRLVKRHRRERLELVTHRVGTRNGELQISTNRIVGSA
jgi:hypothetical protein